MPTPYRAAAAAFASRVTESDLPVLRRLNASQRRDFALDLCALLDFATPGGEPVSGSPPPNAGGLRAAVMIDHVPGMTSRAACALVDRLSLASRRSVPDVRNLRVFEVHDVVIIAHAPRLRDELLGWRGSASTRRRRLVDVLPAAEPAMRRWRARGRGRRGRRGRRGKRGGKRRRARRTKTKPSARPRRRARRSRGCRPAADAGGRVPRVPARVFVVESRRRRRGRARALLRDPARVRGVRAFPRRRKKRNDAPRRDAPRVRLHRPGAGGLGGGRRVSERGVSVVGESFQSNSRRRTRTRR